MTTQLQESSHKQRWHHQLGREFSRAMVNHHHLASYLEPMIQSVRPYWSISSHRARVMRIRSESHTTFTLVLEPSSSWTGFRAGQFIELTKEIDGRRLTRCFSISSSPSHFAKTGTIEITIRVQPGGSVTPNLRSELQAGQFVGLSDAKGFFVTQERSEQGPLLFIAGGSGVTPLRSMLQEMYHQVNPPTTTLLYYAHSANEHLFKEEFQRLSARHPHIQIIPIATEAEGRFNARHLTQYCKELAPRDVYVCGPAGLIESARMTLNESGVPSENIHVEHFGPAPIDVHTDDGEGTVLFSRANKAVQTDSDKPQSILAMAEANGLSPKYGCRMGVCGQCRCPKTAGVVRNTRTGLLSDTGTETIQICVSVPVGEVTIEL